MPIIYTYPTVTPNSDDLVLLTDTSDSQKATKTASVSSILNLSGADSIVFLKKTLNAAQIRSLFSSPVELIAAPGVGKAIMPLYPIFLKYNYGTTQFTNAGATVISLFLGTTHYIATSTVAMIAAAANYGWQPDLNTSAKESFDPTGNTALTLSANVADWTGGDGTLDIYINYKIITL